MQRIWILIWFCTLQGPLLFIILVAVPNTAFQSFSKVAAIQKSPLFTSAILSWHKALSKATSSSSSVGSRSLNGMRMCVCVCVRARAGIVQVRNELLTICSYFKFTPHTRTRTHACACTYVHVRMHTHTFCLWVISPKKRRGSVCGIFQFFKVIEICI